MGHIAKGNTFLKYLLVECVQIHLMRDEPSPIKDAYERIESRSGSKKARIASARHMLRAIYYMLKRKQNYDEYLKKRGGVLIEPAAYSVVKTKPSNSEEGQSMAMP